MPAERATLCSGMASVSQKEENSGGGGTATIL